MRIEFADEEIKSIHQFARLMIGITEEAQKECIEEITFEHAEIPIEPKKGRS